MSYKSRYLYYRDTCIVSYRYDYRSIIPPHVFFIFSTKDTSTSISRILLLCVVRIGLHNINSVTYYECYQQFLRRLHLSFSHVRIQLIGGYLLKLIIMILIVLGDDEESLLKNLTVCFEDPLWTV